MPGSSTPGALARLGPRSILAHLAALVGCGAVTQAFQGPNGPLPIGTHVATFELGAPDDEWFVLRGTLPLPRGVYPQSNGAYPFRLRDAAGLLWPAQVEVVSRSGEVALQAEVVELLARVQRPAGSVVGSRLRYEVLAHEHRMQALTVAAPVAQLLSTPGALMLRATDAYGHAYGTDLYEDVLAPGGDRYKVLRSGIAARTLSMHQTLQPAAPVGGPQATLAHHVGVHAYVTHWAQEEFVTLDLRIHNAHSGLDDATSIDDPLGRLYFGRLELVLPAGWSVLNALPDPFFGAAYAESGRTVQPLVAPLAAGRLHVLPPMAQFERRLVLARTSAVAQARAQLEQQTLAFCLPGQAADGRELWSWWNPATAGYFPQHLTLPRLTGVVPDALRASDQGQLASRLQQLASGAAGIWPATSPGLGWAQPWSATDGGMVGGSEIWLYDGIATAWGASSAGYRMHQLRHRMYTDRQPNVLFNDNGSPTRVEQWRVADSVHGDWLPVWWFNAPMLWAADPFGITSAPQHQTQWVAAQNLAPLYEAQLLSYQPIDESHLGRYTHDAKALVWLGNDALAKDDLRAQAEGFRFSYCELPQDLWGGATSTGLWAQERYAAAHPGNGLAFGRREGWGLDTAAAAFATQPESWRAPLRPWFERILQLLQRGQSTCTGSIQASPLNNVFNAQYRCRQSIEAAIAEHALVGVRESVFRFRDPLRLRDLNLVLNRSWQAMVSPLFWNSAGHAPKSLIALGPYDSSQALYCSFIPADGDNGYFDNYQCWSSLGYAHDLTGLPIYLQRAQEMTGGTLGAALFANPLDNLENRAALLSRVQELGLP